jgi:hypothetical protein
MESVPQTSETPNECQSSATTNNDEEAPAVIDDSTAVKEQPVPETIAAPEEASKTPSLPAEEPKEEEKVLNDSEIKTSPDRTPPEGTPLPEPLKEPSPSLEEKSKNLTLETNSSSTTPPLRTGGDLPPSPPKETGNREDASDNGGSTRPKRKRTTLVDTGSTWDFEPPYEAATEVEKNAWAGFCEIESEPVCSFLDYRYFCLYSLGYLQFDAERIRCSRGENSRGLRS